MGKKAEIVKKFLYVLSYFIRCSEVHENTDPQCLNFIVNEPYLDVSLSPTTSEKTLLDSSGSGLGSFRRTPTPSGSSSGGGRASVGESQNLQAFQKHQQFNCDNVFVEKKLSQTAISPGLEIYSVNGSGLSLNGLWPEKCGCRDRGVNVGHPRIILSCDNCRCSENSFSSQVQTNCIHKSSLMSDSSQHDHSEVFSGGLDNKTPSVGLSELHNYNVPHSLPNEVNTLEKSSPPIISAIDSVPKAPGNEATDFSSSSEQVVRSQSFSGGKVRSRLSQQLETNHVQSSVVVNRGKSAEIQKFFSSSNCGKLSGNSESGNIVKKPPEGGEDSRCIETSSGTCLSISVESKKDAETKPFNCRQSSHHVRPTCLARHR